MRLRICVFTAFLGAAGYLLFHAPDTGLLYVYFASFLLCAGVYSHNNLTDTTEDKINRGRINLFSKNKSSALLVLAFYVSGLLFAAVLGSASFLSAQLFALLGILYNSFKLKRFTIVKNLYTSFGISLIFVMGASRLGIEVLQYYAIVYIIFLIGSVISDIRDISGDGAAGFKTLPVVLGEKKANLFVAFLTFTVFLMILQNPKFYVLLPFEAAVLAFLLAGRANIAHSIGGVSIFALFIWLLFSVI